MQPEFVITEVLNTRGGTDQHGLVFKIVWGDSKETAFMQFDVARKKYPLIVLDYLANRIKQKPICSLQEKQKEKVEVKEVKTSVVSPVTNHSDSPIILLQKQVKFSKCPVNRFFQTCTFCESKSMCTKMLDYDALIPIQSNLAYPVFFKLNTKVQLNQKGKSPKPIQNTKPRLVGKA